MVDLVQGIAGAIAAPFARGRLASCGRATTEIIHVLEMKEIKNYARKNIIAQRPTACSLKHSPKSS